MKNNKGFSLVELVVVFSILLVLTGVVVLNFGVITNWQLNKSVQSIDDNLNKIKVMSLSDSDNEEPTLKLSMNNNDLIINVNDGDDLNLGEYLVTIDYEDVNRDELPSLVLGTQEITISFNNSGGFNEVTGNGYIKKIKLEKNDYSKSIICESLTGKYYIE
jgi:prepilin-type N-terminal cleavage/methylation domain-containing protein